ncbi:DUF4258 domain-containing protein [Ascidiimonas aurantiaca]|uniref:DUF4258 domain-containing protein n=1 Tax=Ascidiimonas aurantiaca TaxID=1685432 RepID=UPI0030EDF7E1
MSLLKRIGFYLIGFAIGLVILSFFFKGKDTKFCYSPNCRVLKELRSKPMELGKGIALKDTLVIKTLLTNGDVVFSKSDTRAKPCKLYTVEGSHNTKEIEITLKNCDSTVIVTAMKEKAN